MNSRIKTTTTDQSDAFNAATEQSIVLWNARCGNDIVQEGDRVGVMRAFGMTWVTAAFLTEYRIGFDYTNRIDLLDLLERLRHRPRFGLYLDLDSMHWVELITSENYLHYGNLHVVECNRLWNTYRCDCLDRRVHTVFLLALLEFDPANALSNVVARAKARWLTKFLKREATQNLHCAALVCRRLYSVVSCADVRLILHRHLCLELTLSRSQHARDTGAVYDTFGDIFSYIFSGSDIYTAGWRLL